MSVFDGRLGMDPGKGAVLCPVIKCGGCGEDALVLRAQREAVTVACLTCASVVTQSGRALTFATPHEPQRVAA
jgi:ribosomal protein S27E